MNPMLVAVGLGRYTVNLWGADKGRYLNHPQAKMELYEINGVEEAVIRFPDEKHLLDFLQHLIDSGVPFLDSDYHGGHSVYYIVKDFVKEGILKRNVVRAVWKNGEYRIEAADD